MDGPFQGTLLELVLLTAVERGWPLDAVPGDDMAAALRPLGYDCRKARLPCKKCCEAPFAMRSVAQEAERASRSRSFAGGALSCAAFDPRRPFALPRKRASPALQSHASLLALLQLAPRP